FGNLDGARDGPPGLAAELEAGHPGQRGRPRRQVPELRHHPEVVANRDVLASQAVPEAEDVAVPDRELASGRREGDRPAIRRKYNERGGLLASHPHVRDRAVACGGHLDQLERATRPPPSRRSPSGPGWPGPPCSPQLPAA